jgi:hypothetical protein
MHQYRPKITVAAAGAAIAVLLTACGGVRTQVVGDGLHVYVHNRTISSGGLDALIVGTLVTDDGCVLLAEGESRFPVVWPSGTSIAGTDPLVIELPSGEQVNLGDDVQGSGGYLDPEGLEIEIPDDCLNPSREVAVFNPDDRPYVTPR